MERKSIKFIIYDNSTAGGRNEENIKSQLLDIVIILFVERKHKEKSGKKYHQQFLNIFHRNFSVTAPLSRSFNSSYEYEILKDRCCLSFAVFLKFFK